MSEAAIYVEGPAGKLHVDDGGSGPELPVLLVHGLCGSASQWAAQLRHLRRSRRAVALDLRGHGRSEWKPGAEISIDALADDVVAAAGALGLDRLALGGFSLGASVAGAAAAKLGPRCAGLFLLDPVSQLLGRNLPDLDEPALRGSFQKMLRGAAPRTRDRVLAELDSTPMAATLAWRNSANSHDAVTPLQRWGGRALAVTLDGNAGNEYRLSKLVPSVAEERIEGTSHWALLDDPDEVNARLDRFLRTLK